MSDIWEDYKIRNTAFEDNSLIYLTALSDALEKTWQNANISIGAAVDMMVCAMKAGNQILACGNGDSAAQAQHFAGELAGRFSCDNVILPCIALTADSSTITAIANDFGYDEVFAHQVRAYGKKGDVLLAISTSGESPNIIKAAKTARDLNMPVLVLTGDKGGEELKEEAAISIIVRSDDTPRIQEVHLFILHLWADWIDLAMKEGGV